MSLSEVKAWKTSCGACFEDKGLAYKEEINGLLKTLPDGGTCQRSVVDFRRLVQSVRGWLSRAEDVCGQMEGEGDPGVARQVR